MIGGGGGNNGPFYKVIIKSESHRRFLRVEKSLRALRVLFRKKIYTLVF